MKYFFISLYFILSTISYIVYKRYLHLKNRIKEEEKINKFLMEISKDFSKYKDVSKLLNKLLIDTLKILDEADAGSILVYNRQKNYMEFVAAVGYDLDELKKINLRKEELYLYKTNKLKSPDIIRNPRIFDYEYIENKKFKMLEEISALNIKSTLSAPIYIDGEFYGVINIDSSRDYNAFNNKHEELIEFLVKNLEIVIKNGILISELNNALRTDKLTGVYNRGYFEEILQKEIKKAKKHDSRFCLVYIDLDKFKTINDTLGHKAGDNVLIHFAMVLKKKLRKTDYISRFGGDEFVLLLLGIDKENASKKMDYIKEYLKEHTVEGIQIEFSYGVCEYDKDMTLDYMLTFADNKMYQQKRRGRKC